MSKFKIGDWVVRKTPDFGNTSRWRKETHGFINMPYQILGLDGPAVTLKGVELEWSVNNFEHVPDLGVGLDEFL